MAPMHDDEHPDETETRELPGSAPEDDIDDDREDPPTGADEDAPPLDGFTPTPGDDRS